MVRLEGHLRGHHHTTTDRIKWVGSDTGTSGNAPTEKEGGEEVTLKGTGEDNWFDGIVHSKVQTTVDDNTKNGGTKTAVPVPIN